jgi:hypothetical protein
LAFSATVASGARNFHALPSSREIMVPPPASIRAALALAAIRDYTIIGAHR